METNDFEKIREKDHAVLIRIQEGDDDVQKITGATTLSNSEVNYCFRKLSDLGFITVEKPDGTVERTINGTRHVFEAPKQAKLTEKARTYLVTADQELSHDYSDLSHDEIVEKVHWLEEEVEQLNRNLTIFRRQVVRNQENRDRD